jgi:hypothetical protein
MWVLRIRGIEESSVYQAIYAKGFATGYARGYAKGYARGYARGRAEASRETLLRLGGERWGEPGERVIGQIMAIDDLDRLRLLIIRVLDTSASTWDELFAPDDSSV